VAARGELAFAGVSLAGSAGALPGALPGYFLGRWLGRERLCAFAARHGRWLTLDERELGQANRLLVAGAFVVRRALGHFAPG
jgi:membrane protein DedA with SNARE-associated domain